MSGMVLNPGQFLDERRYSRKRPQVGLVPTGHRTRDQRLNNPFGLIGVQLGFATRFAFAGKACLAGFGPRRLPTVGNLPSHTQFSANLRSRDPLLKHRSRTNPPLFHLGVISRQRHAQRLHQFLYMSLYYASRNKTLFKLAASGVEKR